ncbi:MAG: efflux RND transporter permease subunit [Candidatus Anaerobiospirillum pullicola]|uniref:Efflux pump membrane transporter n=1 Tax=Candidatus Anaerobiospirillum pullicola TaxID=2838451 RepID=A0A948TGN2_9GAMM|nr:efflux RND transporter permease subunit [Candidatus Anaerobiospirillum pullicola]
MISKFFIDRPVAAWVIAIMIIIAGAICLPRMKIARFPEVAPPSISISTNYSGASAQTVENSVAQIIEQEMTGLDGLLYFSTTSTSDGAVRLRFSFDTNIDVDVAQMQVQNRLSAITSRLPDQVQRSGTRVRKISDESLQTISFYTTNDSMTQEEIADFLVSVVQDPISRLSGVGDVSVLGSEYAMRIWLDQDRLFQYKLNPSDVVSAIENQNRQISVGQIGGLPSVPNQTINVTIKSRELLEDIAGFENILVKVTPEGAAVYLKDVARVEMGRNSYTYFGNYNKSPMASLDINLADGANAVDVAARIKNELERLRPLFPNNLDYAIPYDTVPFITASLYEVGKTLVEALVLVSLVILIFLRDIRSTLIVSLTVPIVLSATVVALYLCDYSINTLTMFAMVLAIGLLVDDAIVVVENINRIMVTQHVSPYDAAVKSMQEITSALFGVGLVIAAVFTPMSFFSGATGNIYRQFSVTIVVAMLMSIMVAVIITPALCATILKDRSHLPVSAIKKVGLFDKCFNALHAGYLYLNHYLLRHKILIVLSFIAITGSTALLFTKIPTSFLPTEDQGVLSVRIILPPSSTMAQTAKVGRDVENYFLEHEVDNIQGILLTLGTAGSSMKGQTAARANIKLIPWEERTDPHNSAQAILDRAKKYFDNYTDAEVRMSLPAAISGMGGSSGFSVYVQNVMGHSHEQFLQDVNQIVSEARADPLLYNVYSNAQSDALQLDIVIDDKRAGQFLLDPNVINENLQIAWGGSYVNDFIDRGRIKRVYVQSDAKFRSLPSDLNKLYFKNSEGKMVAFDTIGSVQWTYGPQQLERFNGISSIAIQGDAAPGVSSGQAMDEIARIIERHPGEYGYAWTGISYQEKITGSNQNALFIISAVVVFLCLAALYESWSIPLAVMLIVPIGIFGALLFIYLRGMSNDVYLQVGLLTTGGLSAKNAILIVEYAHQFRMQGRSLLKSAQEAANLRFRPIVMTSVAFLLGVWPLMRAQGAGAASQQSIGTGVFGGTVFATTLGLIMVPTFFVLVSYVFGGHKKHNKVKLSTSAAEADSASTAPVAKEEANANADSAAKDNTGAQTAQAEHDASKDIDKATANSKTTQSKDSQ